MDIEATIEDLEAQAYFASLGATGIGDASKEIVQVNYSSPENPTCYLSRPLIGKDFIAGFDTKRQDGKSVWLLIPTTALQSVQSSLGEIEVGELEAIHLLRGKLLGERIQVRLVNRVPAISGILIKVQENLLSIQLPSLSLIHVNLTAVQNLAVEKLKIRDRHWA